MDEKLWQTYPYLKPENGSGAVRQIGRFMMMEFSAMFMAKLQEMISEAMAGLSTVYPDVRIHILSGLSGGTGSGCFLDVCYMVRAALQETGCRNAVISGYFFLTDVNLAKIPETSVSLKEKLRMNGYAALQELDYTMGIQDNGGAFQQEYQCGRMISWDREPVDKCFLVGLYDAADEVRLGTYTKASGIR